MTKKAKNPKHVQIGQRIVIARERKGLTQPQKDDYPAKAGFYT